MVDLNFLISFVEIEKDFLLEDVFIIKKILSVAGALERYFEFFSVEFRTRTKIHLCVDKEVSKRRIG